MLSEFNILTTSKSSGVNVVNACALALLVVGSLLLTSSGCIPSESMAEQADTGQKAVPVSTYRVETHTFRDTVEVPADVLANRQVTLMSKIPGEVKKVLVDEGDQVAEGDPLVRLAKKDFKLALRQARAQLAAARAGVEAAQAGLDTVTSKYDRLATLFEQNVIPESNFEDIKGGKRATAAQVSIAKAQLQLARVAVDAAKENLANTVVRAPFDGVVGKMMVDEGARLTVMPPAPLAVIVDLSSAKVVGGIPEKHRSKISAGVPVNIVVNSVRSEPFETVIERAEPIVDPVSRTFSVQAVLPNDEHGLQAGMSAQMRIDLGERDAPALPDDVVLRSALSENTGKVFVIEDGKARERQLTIGARSGELVEITSGLKSGEVVIRGGQELLSDGRSVFVREATGAGR